MSALILLLLEAIKILRLQFKQALKFVRADCMEKYSKKFSGTQAPVKVSMGKRFQQGEIVLPGNSRYSSNISFHRLPVRPILPGDIGIQPLCHQQKPVLLFHAQRYCISGMEKSFVISDIPSWYNRSQMAEEATIVSSPYMVSKDFIKYFNPF